MLMTKGAQHDRNHVRRVTPEGITQDLDESLERLGVETIDLYMLHRDDPTRPVGPIVECLHAHAEAGRVRAYGGSNWTHRRLDEVNAYAAAHGLRPFAVSSPNLALAVPKEPLWHEVLSVAGDREALAWYRARQFPLISWSSQARGFFSGRFSPEERGDADIVRVYYSEENWERLRRAREAAARHGATPTQIALAWVLRQPFPTFALIGPRSVAELRDCLGALDVRLTPDELAWLNLES
jgi:aryl-alcohol dehydrogenase-like predicted oxidoreductase